MLKNLQKNKAKQENVFFLSQFSKLKTFFFLKRAIIESRPDSFLTKYMIQQSVYVEMQWCIWCVPLCAQYSLRAHMHSVKLNVSHWYLHLKESDYNRIHCKLVFIFM